MSWLDNLFGGLVGGSLSGTTQNAKVIRLDGGATTATTLQGTATLPALYSDEEQAIGAAHVDTRMRDIITIDNGASVGCVQLVPDQSSCVIVARAVGRAVVGGDTWTGDIRGTFTRNGGSVVTLGTTPAPTSVEYDAGAAAWNIDLVASGEAVTLTLTGDPTRTVDWCLTMSTQSRFSGA